jgi:hypothetical protein
VSAPQSVLDALADAETLRLIAAEPWNKASALVRDYVEEAECVPRFALTYPELAHWAGRYCARAAFRAVPALREARP